ncbi:hypothetical protein EUZ85_10205 [Hahella sp. KA22]|uniref:hypothetical protein n=1 Tax=Hahella sp. KA22 TaxID=1628392 RepID=UPI000FDCE705|nr:hypothetical protein [Hahella sp. KA22]AZZ91077.1 hypothetical protein ENC22_07650 [Hahella sp. KA22]QAY54447.1 hypothetical protein EUZ85_10205 [Hahella sp. KA22]
MNESQSPEMTMDVNNLYLEEVITDQKIGAIRRLTPVDANGAKDESRKVLYYGQTQMMTPAGALPLNFELEADSLEQAVNMFSEAANKAMHQTIEELKEMRRQAASSIVVPGQEGMGGMPAGGKIQLR